MKYIYILLSSLTILACQQETEKHLTTDLKKEVMAIHDEVMPVTSHLMALRSELKQVYLNDSSQHVTLKPCIDSLKLAHDEMMKWMNNYNHSFSETDTTYYLQQKEKITVVNQLYKTTILSAEQRLKK